MNLRMFFFLLKKHFVPKRQSGRWQITCYKILLSLFFACAFFKKNALSAVIVVTDTPSLQAAITTANAAPDTILFANSITLAAPLPAVTNTYTIDGNNFTLDGGTLYRGFIMIGGAANPTIMDLTIQNVLALGGDGGDAQDVRGGSGGGGLGAGGAIYAGSFAGPTVCNVTFDTCTATGGSAPAPAGGTNSGGGGGGGLGGNGGQGSGAGGNGGGGGGGGYLVGILNDGGDGIANVGGAGGANGGGTGASTGVAATAGTYGGGGGGASPANNAAGVSGAGGYGGGGGGGSSRIGVNATHDAANGGFGAGGGGGGRQGGLGGTSPYGGGTGTDGVGNQGGTGGGGAGLGGAIFTDSSSTVTIMTMVDPFTGSTINFGTGGNPGSTAGLDIFLASGGNLRLNIQGGTVALANPIEADALSAAGGVEKLGPGILNFSGLTNTYRGTTTVTAGTLQFDADANLGSATLLALNGGTLQPTITLTSTKTTSITAPSIY